MYKRQPPEHPRGRCEELYPSSESEDSVSSSETYIEETNLSVNNEEEVPKLWEEDDRCANVEEKGKEKIVEDEQYSYKTKSPFGGSLTKSKAGQRSEEKVTTTNKESMGQKGSVGVDLVGGSELGCGAGLEGSLVQPDVALLVMDLEHKNNSNKKYGALGRNGKLEAQIAEEGLGVATQQGEEAEGSVGRPGGEELGQCYDQGLICTRRGSFEGGQRVPSIISTGDDKNSGVWVSQRGVSSGPEEIIRGEHKTVVDEDSGEVGLRPSGASILSIPVGEEGMKERSKSNSPPRRRKKKGLANLGEPYSHPRRSARLSCRYAQVATPASNRNYISLASISDKDINNCNSQLNHMCEIEEPPNLWEVGKKCGLFCRKDEGEVIKEYGSLEERDLEVVNQCKEGVVKGIP